MHSRRQDLFSTISTEGGILPPDLLQRVGEEDPELGSLGASDYHLSGEKVNEAVNRSWNRLTGAWTAFKAALAKLPESDAGTTLTREKWLLPLFHELGYGRLQTAKAIDLEGKSYPISHGWHHVPIHLVSVRLDMDKRTPGATGASKSSPHSLLQELLNRVDDYLWGFVSNGLRLRILRDNKSLTRQAFVEFDLQAMMDGQVYPDFKLLWLLCHESRVEIAPDGRAEQCRLEQWSQSAAKQGTRALDQLRDGVQKAIEALGRGFLAHPANKGLRDRLQAGTLDKQDYYRQLLRVVYRLIFLFVAEDRGLLFDPASTAGARERYTRFYSTQRLRALAGKLRGTPHADLYHGLRLVFSMLDSDGCPELGLPALGSFLWSTEGATPDLTGADLANRQLFEAVRELSYASDGSARRPVDYKNLGAEELGSIYESLLELHPDLNADAGTFELKTAAGHERKTTGSYYTPTSLVNCLLDSALERVLDEAVDGDPGYKERGATADLRILSLKVCDPACGSGHFLIAAAHRIAKRLAATRTGDEEPAPEAYRHALRDVIGHCIYGVDLNPMAVELCKVSLWMEALEPGRPLSFLDHRIQVGDSLIGSTPALLARGVPDAAFEPIEGDDKALCRAFKRQNKDERRGQMNLFHRRQPWEHLGNLGVSLAQLDAVSDKNMDGVRLKQQSYEQLIKSSTYETGRLMADAWCAAFVWPKTKEFDYPVTESVFRRIEKNPHDIPPWMRAEILRLACQYQFFHWHLAFPDVFRPKVIDPGDGTEVAGWSGGFDVLLGNPPWEQTELKEAEWFESRQPEIANAATSGKRKRLIDQLKVENAVLYKEFQEARRSHVARSYFLGDSGRYPLCGRGRINSYAVFAETKLQLLSNVGRVGTIIPAGIATDETTSAYFRHLVERRLLQSLHGFENEDRIFAGVNNTTKFCLLTLTGVDRPAAVADFVFFCRKPEDLHDSWRHF